ncbi:platelet basic protein-like [Thomomys bottae]
MTRRVDTKASCLRASFLPLLQALLLLSVFLSMLVPPAYGKQGRYLGNVEDDIELYTELRCICLKTISGIHPSKIQSLEVIQSGPHCEKVQVIATLKDGRKVCLDPKILANKKILQNMLGGHESAV